MGLVVECVTFDCTDPHRLALFWTEALDYVIGENKGHWIVLHPNHGDGPLLGLQQVPEAKIVKNRMHLDLRIAREKTLDGEVTRLERLGGHRIRLVDETAEGPHMIMTDPEGNEFCVL